MRTATPASPRRWQATLIISLFLVAVVAAAGTGWWYARESLPHQGPIVLISVDSMQARQLRPYASPSAGVPPLDTPAIDALAADGVLFTRAYAQSPQSLPAQASVLTGQLPFEHGVRDNGGYALDDDARTLAEQLRSRGFDTGGAVSSFLLRPASGVSQGFSFFDAHQPDAGERQPGPLAIERDGVETYAAAEEWMRSQAGQRYFLFLEVGQASADAVVARLVQHLKDRDLYNGATIVLTAAHGDPSSGIRMDDRSLAIPLIVKQPDGEGAGRSVAVPVQQIDIAPTLLEFVRAPIPDSLRGRSLRAVLDGEDETVRVTPLYAESLEALWRFGGSPVFAVTLDGYRLTRGATERLARIDGTSPPAADTDALQAKLSDALDALLQEQPIARPGAIPPADEDMLAALGYVPGLMPDTTPVGPADTDAQAAVVDAHRAAIRRLGSGEIAGAVGGLRSILRAHPDLAVVQYQIGAVLAKSGRFGDAIEALMAAAGLRPDDPEVARALTATYLRARRIEEASARAGVAIALAERVGDTRAVADANETAARVALAARDDRAAAAHAEQAEAADPTRPMIAFVRGRIAYDEGDYESALTAFEAAAEIARGANHPLSELQLWTGETLAQLDRYPEAEAAFREELRHFPSNVSAYASLAMLYRASNRHEEAAAAIEDLITAAPTPDGYATAARLWTIVGQRARADALRADAHARFRAEQPAPASRR